MKGPELLHRHYADVRSKWKLGGTRIAAINVAISERIQNALGIALPEETFFGQEMMTTKEAIPVPARFDWLLDPVDGRYS